MLLQNMWHRLKNMVGSLQTYPDLSPDLLVRRQVNRCLSSRSGLNFQTWYQTFCQPAGINRSVAEFTFNHLSRYSGLKFSHVWLSDRLEADLHWAEICWFDWELTLCTDVFLQFQVDISDCLYDSQWETIGDVLTFLDQHLVVDEPPQPLNHNLG